MVRNRLIRSAFSVLAFAGYLAMASSAQAGFMSNFTGYTQMGPVPGSASATGVVDFAVYNNSAHDFAATTGVTAPVGFDNSASYVYMYEVVNNGGASSAIGTFNINSAAVPYTSAGFLGGTVFSDGSAVGPVGNQYLGPNPGSMPPGDVSVYYPSVSGVGAPTLVSNSNAINPANSLPGGAGNGGVATFQFINLTLGPNFLQPTLTSGLYSSVLFLTSNAAPTYSFGQVVNPNNAGNSDGGIPSQNPEPATLIMWGLGALGFGVAARRRKKLAEKTC